MNSTRLSTISFTIHVQENEITLCLNIYQLIYEAVFKTNPNSLMKYPNEILFDAITLLETVCPQEILLVGDFIENIANDYQAQCLAINKQCVITHVKSGTKLSDPVFLKRYDLAIVSELLESENRQYSEHIIGRLRDLCSPKIIVLANLTVSSWKENELFGFGLNRYSQYKEDGAEFILCQHNIDSYKRTPDWFNPKNWANPQLWNKFWW